jgi:hypothetical protein
MQKIWSRNTDARTATGDKDVVQAGQDGEGGDKVEEKSAARCGRADKAIERQDGCSQQASAESAFRAELGEKTEGHQQSEGDPPDIIRHPGQDTLDQQQHQQIAEAERRCDAVNGRGLGVEQLADEGADQHPQRMVSVRVHHAIEGTAHAVGEVPRNLEVEVAVVGKEDARLGEDHGDIEGDREQKACFEQPICRRPARYCHGSSLVGYGKCRNEG